MTTPSTDHAPRPGHRAPRRPARPPAPVPPRRGPGGWQVVMVIVAALVLGSLAGMLLFIFTPGNPSVPALLKGGDSPTPAALHPLPLPSVAAFDPPPGDGQEDDAEVGLAHDGNTATFWHTETYFSADVGGLKKGVGLLVDLGRSRAVKQVKISFAAPGTSLELRAGNTADAASLPVVASRTDAPDAVTLTPAAGTDARYWLVWLTRLPPDTGGFRAKITEMSFLG